MHFIKTHASPWKAKVYTLFWGWVKPEGLNPTSKQGICFHFLTEWWRTHLYTVLSQGLRPRARHFYAKVRNLIGAVWIIFTNVSSISEKKELGLYLLFRPPWSLCIFYKGICPKIQRKNLTFSFFEIFFKKSCQNGLLQSNIKMSDQYGSFDTHIAIFGDIYVIW